MAAPEPAPRDPHADESGRARDVAAAGPPVPAMRASDADRERVAAILRDAGADGRLAVHELDERLDSAYGAVTRDDLAGLTTDLVAAGRRDPAGEAGAVPTRVAVRDADDGTRWIVAVMGGAERSGRWRIGRSATALALMGGIELDLQHAEFDGRDVHLRVVSVMGGAEVRVPEHMNVVVSDLGLMGANDVRIGEATPDPGGPTLHLRLVSVMGGTSVRRGPKPTRADRREARARRRMDRHGGGHGGGHGLPPAR